MQQTFEALPPERRIALALTHASLRPALHALLALDARLGGLVTRTREPLLGQIRLAWWRERLSETPPGRPQGDPLLDAIAAAWPGSPALLVALVDGWEELLGPAPLPSESLARFAAGRGASLVALADLAGAGTRPAAIAAAGKRWALADFAGRSSHSGERAAALALAAAIPPPEPLPRALRGIAVLDGLAARAVARGEPLLAGRGAALAALRLGMFGR